MTPRPQEHSFLSPGISAKITGPVVLPRPRGRGRDRPLPGPMHVTRPGQTARAERCVHRDQEASWKRPAAVGVPARRPARTGGHVTLRWKWPTSPTSTGSGTTHRGLQGVARPRAHCPPRASSSCGSGVPTRSPATSHHRVHGPCQRRCAHTRLSGPGGQAPNRKQASDSPVPRSHLSHHPAGFWGTRLPRTDAG